MIPPAAHAALCDNDAMNDFGPAPPPVQAGAAFGRGLLQHWLLEPDIAFLNHGSYGATPRAVLAAQSEWRSRMERQPVRFMNDELPGALRAAAARLGRFVGAAGDNIAFVDNATTAVNTVLASFDWRAGDEIAVCRHVYPGVRSAIAALERRYGVVMRSAEFPVPLAGAEQVVAAFAAALDARTRLAIVDHVSSPLAVVLPVAEIAALCANRGVPVLIDGAHAPGMLALDLDALGADWYTGNGHKWLYAPKGAAFLWTAPARAAATHPLVISSQWGQGYAREFDWTGTRDTSAWLAVPAALDFFESLGVERARAYMHGLAAEAARLLASRTGTQPLAPPGMFAAMVTLPLPASFGADASAVEALHRLLVDRYRVEVPLHVIDGRLALRISAQVYNEIRDYERLGDALRAMRR